MKYLIVCALFPIVGLMGCGGGGSDPVTITVSPKTISAPGQTTIQFSASSPGAIWTVDGQDNSISSTGLLTLISRTGQVHVVATHPSGKASTEAVVTCYPMLEATFPADQIWAAGQPLTLTVTPLSIPGVGMKYSWKRDGVVVGTANPLNTALTHGSNVFVLSVEFDNGVSPSGLTWGTDLP